MRIELFITAPFNRSRVPTALQFSFYASNKYLASILQEKMDLLLYRWINHHLRPLAIRASESWCCSEQTADQWTFCIDLTAIFSKVWTAQCC